MKEIIFAIIALGFLSVIIAYAFIKKSLQNSVKKKDGSNVEMSSVGIFFLAIFWPFFIKEYFRGEWLTNYEEESIGGVVRGKVRDLYGQIPKLKFKKIKEFHCDKTMVAVIATLPDGKKVSGKSCRNCYKFFLD